VARLDKTRLQIISPYSGHRQKSNAAFDTISLEEINLAEEPEVIYQSKKDRKPGLPVDQYVSGEKTG
jgi:hypothetical protein